MRVLPSITTVTTISEQTVAQYFSKAGILCKMIRTHAADRQKYTESTMTIFNLHDAEKNSVAARRCLPPGANVCVCRPHSDQICNQGILGFRTSRCERTFGVPSSSLPSYSLHFPLLSLPTVPFSIPSP